MKLKKEKIYYVGLQKEEQKAIMFFCTFKDSLPADLFKYIGFFSCQVPVIKKQKKIMLEVINKEFNTNFEKLEYVFN